MPHQLFISYRRDVDMDFVDRVRDRFTYQYGMVNVYFDIESGTSGGNFVDELTEAVRNCDACVVIICQDWTQQFQDRDKRGEVDYVLLEVTEALKDPNKHVIPVVADASHIPDVHDLPKDIQPLLSEKNVIILPMDLSCLPDEDIEFTNKCKDIFHDIELKSMTGSRTQTTFPQAQMTADYQRADDILAVGIDLDGTLQVQREHMQRALDDPESGKQFRMLFVDPRSEACRTVYRRGGYEDDEHESLQIIREGIMVGLREAFRIKRRVPGNDRFKIAITDIAPTYGATGFDLYDEQDGVVYVWNYCYKPENKSNLPIIVVYAKEDPVLFRSYREQLYKMWRDARVLDSLDPNLHKGGILWRLREAAKKLFSG